MSKEFERLGNKNLPCANCKALKALEIIREKRVDVSLIIDLKSLQEYNEKIPQYVICSKNGVDRLLTQKEYELLKEVLE